MSRSSHLNIRTLNRLRAAVLGANDGIVSTSSVVMGVAGAGAGKSAVFTAGMAALVAGALSMAVGEYVSTASQLDAEKAHAEKHSHENMEFTSPTQAAVASLISFIAGGLVPFLAVLFSSRESSIFVVVIAVIIALIITGYSSARFGNAKPARAIARVVVGGILAMGITYLIGQAFGSLQL